MQVRRALDRVDPTVSVRVTVVYLDASVLALSSDRDDGSVEPVALPGAGDALGYLADGQHEIVVLGDPPAADELPTGIRVEPELPADPPHGSWLITDDPEGCHRRAPGLRSILVGPKRAPTNRPTARCDMEARDLSAAIMEILTREAMA